MTNAKNLQELEQENRLLRQILDHISDGVQVVTKDGQIIVYNKTMEKIEGTENKYVLGYADTEVYNIFPFDQFIRSEMLSMGKPIKNRRMTYHMATGYKVEMVADAYPYVENGELTAFYYIMQDISNINHLQERIMTLSNLLSQEKEQKSGRNPNGTIYSFPDIIGDSPSMQETVQRARQIATSSSNVLIYGETGTGKELFAQSIHNASHFKNGPFIAVNCASIPNTLLESQLFGTVRGAFSDARDMPGFFEQAENGSLFLDEINSMDISLQAKLLRVLQDKTICRLGSQKARTVNCRIICATNKNPLKPDFKEFFREDLLYRLMTIVVLIPPLRERKEDIPLLCHHFIDALNKRYNTRIVQIEDDFMNLLIQHEWPGNVRQLANLLESCICYLDIHTNSLKVQHIPSYLQQQFPTVNYQFSANYPENGDLPTLLEKYERKIIEESLRMTDGNIAKAARRLGVSRQNMNYRLKRLAIHTKKR